ncbi:MAG TPA: starch synthase, partial [Lachnospiraceae bacterium]|nr:starch synthase [Lachnospiraceae bacterium]
MKNILFAASECVPFIKTGGLADVVGSLPKYFQKEYFDCRVVMPKYKAIPEKYTSQMQYITNFYMDLNWRQQYVGVFKLELDGITCYFIDNEEHFS